MIKNKIKKIIFSKEFTDEELEMYCHYDRGDRYDYGTYDAGYVCDDEKACYSARVEKMVNDIAEYGVSSVLGLPVFTDEPRFADKVVQFLKKLA